MFQLHFPTRRSSYLDSINHTITICDETIETDLRVFHLTNLATEKPVIWVEGIGSIAGLHANHYSIDCDKMDEGLVCKKIGRASGREGGERVEWAGSVALKVV